VPNEEIALHNPGEIVRAAQPTPMELIAAIARDPSIPVDRIAALIGLQERMEAREAEKAFHAAMARLQPQLPAVERRGMVAYSGTKFNFATYEDIDDAIRPLLCAEGFSLSFNSTTADGKATYTGTLAHSAGHSKSASMILPADETGGKNKIQAVGSTISYAKRYLVGMLLNIVTKGIDDDANSADPISDDQALGIRTMLDVLAMTPPQAEKFWAWTEVPTKRPEDIQRRQYEKIRKWLAQQLRGKK
jgi:ERF superfamily